MGLSANIASELVALARAGAIPRDGTVLEIGAQQLGAGFMHSWKQLAELERLFGRPKITFPGYVPPRWWQFVPWTWPWEGNGKLADAAPSARIFWEQLGWSYTALDYDGHRDSVALDLNVDSVPASWRNRFDLVLNGGTTEHVANQDNAMRVIHDAVRVGGVMLHEVPMLGMPTHGLVSYGMRFFWMLCRDNGYEVLSLEPVPGNREPMHRDVVDTIQRYGRGRSSPRLHREAMRHWAIIACLRKTQDAPFRTPLDIPNDLAERLRAKA